jgi:hypothetical protein
MDEQDVRAGAEALCDALVRGDIEQATEAFSAELRRNLGEVIALLPLPATAASIGSIAHGGSSYVVVLELVGENETVQVQTRWKERDGRPTVIEASHLSRVELEPPPGDEDVDGDRETAADATA